MLERGLIHVYTGEGKGKTTAALGLALRAISRGLRVYMIQFLKIPNSSGEHFLPKIIAQNLIIKPMGRPGFLSRRPLEPEDVQMAKEALEDAHSAMLSGDYDVIILDEANVAVKTHALELRSLLEFVASKPKNVELIITGRDAHPDVIKEADVAVEMKKIKHIYDQGTMARRGIEF